jgi:hypothetical protein
MFAARFGGRLSFSATHAFRWLLFARSSPLAVPKIPGIAVGCQNWEASLDFQFWQLPDFGNPGKLLSSYGEITEVQPAAQPEDNVGPLASRVILTVPTRLAVPARQEDQ